jgi:hypothetical protein
MEHYRFFQLPAEALAWQKWDEASMTLHLTLSHAHEAGVVRLFVE